MLFFIILVYLSVSLESKIGHRLNASLGILFVYPDLYSFDNQDHFLTKLQDLLEENISIDSISYSNYSISNKYCLSESSSNLVFLRNGKFLQLYIGNMSVTSIATELNQAFYSYIDIINESNYDIFTNETKSFFLLKGPSISDEYENLAFIYRNRTVRFAYQFQPIHNSTIQFIDTKHNTTRDYDDSIPLIQFVRSCKVQKSHKKSFRIKRKSTTQSHMYQLTALTDNYTQKAESAFDFINRTDIGSMIDFGIVSWDNSTEILHLCDIQPSDLIFVLYSKSNKRKYVECNVFQDMDFFSNELLYFFVRKATTVKIMDSSSHLFFPHYYSTNFIPSSRHPCETATNQISFIYIEPTNSYSIYDSRAIYNTLAYEFYTSNRAEQTKSFKSPVEFYTIEYAFDNFRLPNADGFPAFVIYKPRNKQGYLYNDIISIEKVRNWIQQFQQEEYEDKSNETINQEPTTKEDNPRNDILNMIFKNLKTSLPKNSRKPIIITSTQHSSTEINCEDQQDIQIEFETTTQNDKENSSKSTTTERSENEEQSQTDKETPNQELNNELSKTVQNRKTIQEKQKESTGIENEEKSKIFNMPIKLIRGIDDINKILKSLTSDDNNIETTILSDDASIDLTVNDLLSLNTNIETKTLDLLKSDNSYLKDLIKKEAIKSIQSKYGMSVSEEEIDPIVDRVLNKMSSDPSIEKIKENQQEKSQDSTNNDKNEKTEIGHEL